MLWPITTASLFVYFAWSEIFRNSWRFMDLMFSCLFLTFGTALAALVGVGIAALIGLFIPKTWYGPESTELVSLRGSDGTSGTFFLGSGAIQAEHFCHVVLERQKILFFQQVSIGPTKQAHVKPGAFGIRALASLI